MYLSSPQRLRLQCAIALLPALTFLALLATPTQSSAQTTGRRPLGTGGKANFGTGGKGDLGHGGGVLRPSAPPTRPVYRPTPVNPGTVTQRPVLEIPRSVARAAEVIPHLAEQAAPFPNGPTRTAALSNTPGR